MKMEVLADARAAILPDVGAKVERVRFVNFADQAG